MIFGTFSFFPKSFLGVDIGTSSLKVVELSKWGNRKSLKNYGELKAEVLYEKPFRTFEKNTLLLSSEDIGRALRAILQEAKIESREAAFSLPDFSSFFTNFELPPMSSQELPDAVRYEARRHIPLPISEVAFDWQVIGGKEGGKEPLQILMVAVPNEVLNQYRQIAQLAGLKLSALEAEVFGLLRASPRDDKVPQLLLDIGAQSTTISAVTGKAVNVSHSIDTAGNSFTARIAESLSVEYPEAEKQKIRKGLNSPDNTKVLSPLLDLILLESQKVMQQFERLSGEKATEVMLGGASARLPGLSEYIERNLNLRTEIINPFRDVFYPSILEDTIQEMGPSYAVAVGMALRGLHR